MALVEDTEAEDFKPICIVTEEVLPLAQDIQNTGVAAVAVTGLEDMEDTMASVAPVDICRGISL